MKNIKIKILLIAIIFVSIVGIKMSTSYGYNLQQLKDIAEYNADTFMNLNDIGSWVDGNTRNNLW